ncbi:hypothetical protein E3U43_014704 [Larimichthys crocea]|uniref:Uncharacterized protein n=1 Tax=Larimichthys crocea TaxID=215358 RepID=A0ACD3QPD8_LARCR|nr:hypothetical protein E3U43_014704 [Larimichthys crocea]
MPLLCISLLALLLLPLSLSCGNKRSQEDVRNDYMAIVKTRLENTRESVTSAVQNLTCPRERKHKLPNCTSNVDVVTSLHNLTCIMMYLRLDHTDRLASSVLNSIRCPCLERPTKQPSVRSKRRRATTTRQRRNEHKKSRRQKKLCRAKAILSKMTVCYQILNTMNS